jgi:hypothetical protein
VAFIRRGQLIQEVAVELEPIASGKVTYAIKSLSDVIF